MLHQHPLPSSSHAQTRKGNFAGRPAKLDIAGGAGGALGPKEPYRLFVHLEGVGRKGSAPRGTTSHLDERSKSQRENEEGGGGTERLTQRQQNTTETETKRVRSRRERMQEMIKKLMSDPEYILTDEYLRAEDALLSTAEPAKEEARQREHPREKLMKRRSQQQERTTTLQQQPQQKPTF